MTSLLRRAVVFVMLLGATLGATTPRRHLSLVKSAPAKDSVVTTPPTVVQLWFSEAVPLSSTRVRLTREGTAVALAAATRAASADAPVVVPIRTALPAGVYTVQWATASKDGHPVQGSFRFTVKPAP